MAWARRAPPFGNIRRRKRERFHPLIDPRAAADPSWADSYNDFRSACEELRGVLAKDRDLPGKATEVTISRQAAGYLSVALEVYSGQLEGAERQLSELQQKIQDAKRAYATSRGNR